jgi:hypothetical protein
MKKAHIETVIENWQECGDPPSWDDLQIILSEHQAQQRLVKQCGYIIDDEPTNPYA